MTCWAVVHTQTGAEYQARGAIRREGYIAWLPEYVATVTQARRGRPSRGVPMRETRKPLFPGYLFVPLLPETPWWPIMWLPGVLRVLTGPNEQDDPVPLTLPHEVVKGLQERMAAAGGAIRLDGAAPTRTRFKPGQAVRVKSGPAGDLRGLVAVDAGRRVGALLDILGGRRLVWVAPEMLETFGT